MLQYTENKTGKKVFIALFVVGAVFLALGALFSGDGHTTASRFWSNFHTTSLFFSFIALGATFFMAVQYAAFAGWSTLLLRVMSAFSTFLPIGLGLVLWSILASVLHLSHIFHWMDPELTNIESEHYDAIIAGKTGYLNNAFFIARSLAYIAIWIFFARKLRGFLFASSDKDTGVANYKAAFKYAVVFLVLFAVTSSTSAWDWVMSIDPHWFSTLFGWYTFASYFVTAIAFIIIVTIVLKKQGYLEAVNDNHLHDLGKFLFGFSIFWTYLFFSQYMLIWYSNIPEEVVYFQQRLEQYQFPFVLMLVMNFALPLLILVSRPTKRKYNYLIFVAALVIVGHWIDFFVMVMPGTVKNDWGIGFIEIGMFLVVLSVFLFTIFKALTKGELVDKNHPLLDESVHHHQ